MILRIRVYTLNTLISLGSVKIIGQYLVIFMVLKLILKVMEIHYHRLQIRGNMEQGLLIKE